MISTFTFVLLGWFSLETVAIREETGDRNVLNPICVCMSLGSSIYKMGVTTFVFSDGREAG